MKCGHLFNGIGGFALAAHWMGWDNVMHCEIDPFCNKVMNYHFPNSYQHEDIRTTDFTIWRGKLDLITGGFPCQPYSTAGKRKGKDDDRHLWPQMLRAIREIQPSYVVGENVRGLTNWNGGLVFDEVQADLEAEGYEVLPFLLPAAGVNAPHRRDRIWFVAYSNGYGFGRDKKLTNGHEHITGRAPLSQFNSYVPFGATANTGCIISDGRESYESEESVNNRENSGREETTDKPERLYQKGVNTDAAGVGLEGRVYDGDSGEKGIGIIEGCSFTGRDSKNDWQDFPTQSPVCNRNDGFPGGLVDFAVPGRNGTRILSGKQAYGRWRKESIKALGNAIVPQVAFQIFKAIEQYEL